ncbi:hypothetical protein E3J62_03700 [candidate division TA06 bacterium]|uniref:LamG domain-containing protein n=1 Tax=candidate division TA06 bacterium TaxID=2250710 RepID=A0A523UVZ9_UNCT6|nr:MAG: hypothetical protein E3J62_03700 [candidate division TA06 bacterium]
MNKSTIVFSNWKCRRLKFLASLAAAGCVLLFANRCAGEVAWWDTDHDERAQLIVQNQSSNTLYAGYPVAESLDTGTLVSAGDMLASGNDLRIIYYNGASNVELDRRIIYMNSDTTLVWFAVQQDIAPSAADSNYWMYYNHPSASAPNVDIDSIFVPPKDGYSAALYFFESGSGTTLEDTSGNDNDGTVNNMDNTNWVEGKHSLGLHFDGSSEYISVPDDAILDIEDEITLETWFKLDNAFGPDSENYDMSLLEKGPYGLRLDHVTGELVFSLSGWTVEYDSPQSEIYSLALYNGKLFAGTGESGIVHTFDGATWSSEDITDEKDVMCLCVYGGKLYAGTGEAQGIGGGKIYVYDGISWVLEYDTPSKNIRSMAVYRDTLFAGSGNSGLVYKFDGTSWSSQDITNDWDIFSLRVYNNKLYAGTGNPSAQGKGYFYSYDGTWSLEYDSPSKNIYSMAVYTDTLFATSGDEGLVYKFDGTSWSSEDITSQKDVLSIFVYSGKLYAGTGTFGSPIGAGLIYEYDGSSWSLSYNTPQKDVFSLGDYNGLLYLGTGNSGIIYTYPDEAVLASAQGLWNAAQFYHVAGTFDGSDMKIFVDGILDTSNSVSVIIDKDTSALMIGGGIDTTFFRGSLDGMGVSGVARTDFWYAKISPEPTVALAGTGTYTSMGDINRSTSDGNIAIYWRSVSGRTYDVFYCDTLQGTYTDVADVVASGDTTSWTDDGSATGTHPDSVVARFYRVECQTGALSRNTTGKMKRSIVSGMQLVSNPFIPYNSSIQSVLGGQLTGAADEGYADRVWKYDTDIDDYVFAWLVAGVGAPYDGKWWSSQDFEESTMDLGPDCGFWIQSRNAAQEMTFVGEVSDTSDRVISIVSGMQLFGSPYPDTVLLKNSDLIEDGATGATTELNADRIWWWDPDSTKYDYAWLVDDTGGPNDSLWWDSDPWGETSITLRPGEGYWYQTRGNPFTWSYSKPYDAPPNP